MIQPDSVLRAFVEFSDAFTAGDEVATFLERLAACVVTLVGTDDAVAMMVDASGALRPAGSHDDAALAEIAAAHAAAGPALDAYRLGRMVSSISVDDAAQRWPAFGARVGAIGYRSSIGVPLRARDDSIGALLLLARHDGGLSDDEQRIVQALADVATIAVLQARALADAHVVTAQLQTALTSRVTIEQAKGVVAEHLGTTVDQAFDLLRRYARANNLKLNDVARRVVAGTLRPPTLTSPAPQRRR